ncbi:hypothetical protein [Streptomyces sp. FR-008]|uniref:hypothetical protein n=1 Tax=Streptomyces sp. FR-008 TaxID=206662 RepID=UPI0013312D5C|nr:hypothetical protein [Streptomyces sp. FR-008]
MARPMNRLPQSNEPLVAFARDLQTLRAKAGNPPLKLMAEHSSLSTATLSNAHAGKKLPTWMTVNGYVLACGGDPKDWIVRWEKLRLAAAGATNEARRDTLVRWERTGVLTPSQAADEAELRELLRTLLDFNRLSHRALARQSPGYSHVTYGAVLRGTRPLKAKILYQILIGCGVHSFHSQEEWLNLLSSFSWQEAVEAGKLLAQVDQQLKYAGDIDMWMLQEILEGIKRSEISIRYSGASHDSFDALQASYEDMLILLLSSLQRSRNPLPYKYGHAFNRVVGDLQNNLLPHPGAIAVLLPFAMPFHPQLRREIGEHLKASDTFLRGAEKNGFRRFPVPRKRGSSPGPTSAGERVLTL